MFMMDPLSTPQKQPDIVIVGGDPSMHYLLERYAGRMGYPVRVAESPVLAESIRQSEPVAVIFPSVDVLEGAQALVAGLTNSDIPIIVCSSAFDQAKTRELGADYCLLHPLIFDSFSSTLSAAVTSQHKERSVKDEETQAFPINPV
jgi:DNA-binding response OmpR family regulator